MHPPASYCTCTVLIFEFQIRVKGFLKEKYREYRLAHPEEPLLPPSSEIPLKYGSLYGTHEGEKLLQRKDGESAHDSGYLEILNKSDYVCCLRVYGKAPYSDCLTDMRVSPDMYRESCRPSFVTCKCAYIDSSLYMFYLHKRLLLTAYFDYPRCKTQSLVLRILLLSVVLYY